MPCVCLFHHGGIIKLVGMEGVEPPRLSAVDFESTTSAIPSHTHYKFGSLMQNRTAQNANRAIIEIISLPMHLTS